MKEELYVFIDNERYQLDLTSPSGITLKWVSNLFNDISKLTCSYSYTFKLPITQNNRRVLKLTDDIRHNGGLERKVIPAEFYINGVCLCPNANLHVSELSDSISCVMTWRVLKGFETLKSNGGKLTDLNGLGRIQWGDTEEYGGTDGSHSNMDAVLYPDYDAGMPHEADTPPKPCVPIYRLIQMINETYGVKINFGSLVESGMGLKREAYLNNPSYNKKRVYDDYVSYGVLPLVNKNVPSDKYAVRGLSGIASHTIKQIYLECTQKWQMYSYNYRMYGSLLRNTLHYGIIEGEYTGLQRCEEEGVAGATYKEPKTLYVGIPVFDDFRENEFIKKVYIFQHDTGLSLYKQKKDERAQVDAIRSNYSGGEWTSRTYQEIEQVTDTWGTEVGSPFKPSIKCIEDTTGVLVYHESNVGDTGKNIGAVGFFTRQAFTLKGSATLHITPAAVAAGQIDINDYQWICLAKKSSDKEELEIITEKDISSCVGFMSTDIPTFNATTGTYVCHFDFGQTEAARRIEVDACDEESLTAYVFLPYFPSDYLRDVYEIDENGNYVLDENNNRKKTGEECSLNEGDIYFEKIEISAIIPTVEDSILPIQMNVSQSLPEISCFDFIKSLFYMNGAMPRVERDGETVSAMFYKQLRDRINDGKAIDWSGKLLSTSGDLASSVKYHNTNFSKDNYLEMAYSQREKKEEELLEELDQYGKGYGTIHVDDSTLTEERSLFKSVFHPAYEKNIRYPLVKTGKTCKVWEGDKTLVESVPPIYGVMILRKLDPSFEDVYATRPGLSDIEKFHIRMNIFSPFDNEAQMEDFFGYLKAVLNSYVLIKEKFELNEMDLRDFDESVPVYLSKYNAFFAVSTIQRDKDGVCTVELVKLPRVKEEEKELDMSYEVEILNAGTVTFDAGEGDSSTVYIQRTVKGEWETSTARSLDFGSDGIHAITADNTSSASPVLRIFAAAVGQYRYTYTDNDTGLKSSIVRSEANIFFDGREWNKGSGCEEIAEGDGSWHSVEIEIPIRNELGVVVERRRWKSPFFVSSKSVIDYDESEARYAVSMLSTFIAFQCNLGTSFDNGNNGTDYITYHSDEYLPIPINDSYQHYSYYVPNFLCPLRVTYYQNGETQSYKLKVYPRKTMTYILTKYVGANIVSTKRLEVKVRCYYDDVRMIGGTEHEIVYTQADKGQYHVFKIIADFVDEEGVVIERYRKKLYWFVSSVDASVITQDFGDEHNDDETIKVNNVQVTCPTYLYDLQEHDCTLKFTPEYADVNVSSVQVTSNVDSSVLTISNVGINGFKLQAVSLPVEAQNIVLTIRANLEDNTYFDTTHTMIIQRPILVFRAEEGYSSQLDFEATNGSGNRNCKLYLLFRNSLLISAGLTITSLTSSNAAIAVQNIAGNSFTLVASNISQNETATITAIVDYEGYTLTASIEVTATFKNTWSIQTLDNAGALIIDRNGNLYTEAEWLASGILNEDADGIAVSNGSHRFIIAKGEISGKIGGYSSELVNGQLVEHGTLVSGQTTATDAAIASTDFNGVANTTAIIQQVANTDVSRLRTTQQFPSGIQGYLGAVGEWLIVHQMRDKVKRLLSVIGATALRLEYPNDGVMYGTSTQYNQYREWLYTYTYQSPYYELLSYLKDTTLKLRAFAEVRTIINPIQRGSISITGADTFAESGGAWSSNYTIGISPVGATLSEVSVTSDNEFIQVSNVTNNGFTLSGDMDHPITHEATITVRARVNGLIETCTKHVTATGSVAFDYDRLDEEKALIIDVNYNLYTEEEWNAASVSFANVEGIAVSDGTHRFIIAKTDSGDAAYGPAISVMKYGVKDFDGEGNTEQTISRWPSPPYNEFAAHKARNANVFPTGAHGYLGSAGEWKIVVDNIVLIQSLIAAVHEGFSSQYWTSSMGSETGACKAFISQGTGSVKGNYVRDYGNPTRPFRKIR